MSERKFSNNFLIYFSVSLQESNAWVQEIIANIRSILISFQQQYRSLAQSTNSTPMITPVHKLKTAAGESKQNLDVSQWILSLHTIW